MNFQSDILFTVIFVLTTLINSSGAFGWYDGYRYNLFAKPHISKNKQEDSQALLSLWSKYHFLRRRRSSLDANIFKPNALFMKRFFHFSPLIFMKNKNTKSNKTKLKTLKKHEKHVYRPFNAFGIFINALRKPLKTEPKDPYFTEIVPEINTDDDFNSQTEENPSLDQSVLDFSNEQSSVVPNLSENVQPFRPRPHKPIQSIPTSVVSEGGDTLSDSHLGNVNHFGIETNTDPIGSEILGAGHHSRIPTVDENSDGLSAQHHHGINTHSKETAKNLNLPQVVLEPIHQRASVSGGFDQLGFSDSDTLGQGVFGELSNEPMNGFDTGFVDGFQGSHGTFHDTITDNSDVSNGGQITGDIPETFGFSDDGAFLVGDGRLTDQDLLSNTGSTFEDPFSPYGSIDNFYDQEFGGGFENLDNIDSSEIAGGEFFDDGNDFEGFFDTDESGCDGIRTRPCTIDAECSCLGLYFCIEGMCGMRAALPTSDHGVSSDTSGTWLDTPADFR